MNKYERFLNSVSVQLIKEGKWDLAEEVNENWDEFLELLEQGKLDFDFLFSGSPRGKDNVPNRGRETPAFGVPGPQADD
jgi:hypothetical protein